MDQDGQAGDGPEDGFDAAAQLLMGNPGIDSPEPEDDEDEQDPADETQEGASDEETDEPAEGEDEKSKPEDAEQAPGQKFKVTVKGDDGADQTLEVDQKELVAGYQRHKDYTHKTMALAEREREAFQTVTAKIGEYREHYVQQAQSLRAVLAHAAGSRSADEMAALAQTDPSAWVQESQRQQALQGLIASVDQQLRQEADRAQQIATEQSRGRQKRMAEVLTSEGFDLPKMQSIFQSVNKAYGFTADQLRNVDDPALVRMMRDAAEYQALKSKKAEVTKKVAQAPALPPARRPVSKSEQVSRQINSRFKGGKAGLRDLQAFLQHHQL